MTLSAWVLVIVLGGWNDRGVAVTTIDMPTETACVAAAAQARAGKPPVNISAFCINREDKK